jgi:hypothetical protein
MPGPRCQFCQKGWVQPCWDADEAANCGNLTPEDMTRIRAAAKAVDKVDAVRGARARATRAKPTK